MFWKKKDDNQDFQHIKVPADSRKSYRISPSELDPIVLEFDNVSVEVNDISSGGLSFKNQGFKAGQSLNVRFTLPYTEELIEGKIEILRIGAESICHGKLHPVKMEMEDAIHQYVLERQKEDLRFK